MKFILATLIVLIGSGAQALTSGRFLGQQFMINIATKSYDGSVDELPQKIFEGMNVPVQDSILGPGKALKAPEKILNFICANRTGSGGYTCMLLIHSSEWAQLGAKKASLRIQGDLAQSLAAQFHLNQGVLVFSNSEGTLEIKVTPNELNIRFAESGL